MGKRKMYKNAPIICDGRDGMSFVLYIIGWISRAAVHFACTFGSSLFIADAFGITSPRGSACENRSPRRSLPLYFGSRFSCIVQQDRASLRSSCVSSPVLRIPMRMGESVCAHLRLASLRLGYRHVPHGGVGIRFVFLICLRPGILI